MDIMDTEIMDTLGRKGYEAFAKYYTRVWEDYQNYGEVVLTKHFGEKEENELKLLFRDARDENFQKRLYNFWMVHYLIKIQSYQDLEKAYLEMHFNESYRIYSEKCVGTNWNTKPRVVISETMLKEIDDKIKKYRHNNAYVKGEKNMYLVKIHYDGGMEYISVIEVIPLEAILS